MNFVLHILAHSLIFILSSLPQRFLKPSSSVIAYLVHNIFGYRKEVSYKNIKNSFPKKAKSDILAIQKDFYKHLVYLALENIKYVRTGVPLEKIKAHTKELDTYLAQGRSIMVLVGHYGIWEYISCMTRHIKKHSYICYSGYYPTKYDSINSIVTKYRSIFGGEMVASDQVLRTLLDKNTPKKHLICMFPDQSVFPSKTNYWIDFLGQKSIASSAPEKLAKRKDYVVLYGAVIPSGEGNYSIHIKLITDRAKETEDAYITQRFHNLLEEDIHQNPPYWLWSHRRWKHTYPKS